MVLAYDAPRFFKMIPKAMQSLSFSEKYLNFNSISDSQVSLTFSAPLTSLERSELDDLMATFDINYKDVKDITPRQFRQAWVLSGRTLESVSQFIQTLPEPQRSLVFIEWEYSTVFQRENLTIKQLAPLFGLGDQALDDLFVTGASL